MFKWHFGGFIVVQMFFSFLENIFLNANVSNVQMITRS